jgi:hypothetical protein
MSSDLSFSKFRSHLHSVDLPCIPYLGLYLNDLSLIEEGNPDFFIIDEGRKRKEQGEEGQLEGGLGQGPGTGQGDGEEQGEERLINFEKKRKLSLVIREVLLYQRTPYRLLPVPFIQDNLKHLLLRF